MSTREVEAQVRAIINRADVEFTSEEVRAREEQLSELVELRMGHSGNLFFVRKGAPKDLELISPLDRVVVDDLYDWKRPRKRQRYLQLKADQKYSGPIMVAEGDSWFEHPLIPDLIDWAGKGYAVLSLARAGDTWSNILDEDSDPAKKYSDGTLMGLIHTVNQEDTGARPPGTILLSAGGNDLIGQISKCVYHYDPKRPEDKYINHAEFDPILGLVLHDYRTKTRVLASKAKTIILHSYDYPNPMDNGQYIGLPLRRDRNIPGVGLMRRIVNQMIDFLADGLIDIAANSNGHAHFVNLRGTIGTRDYLNGPDQLLWSDEMHGSRQGFERLWDVLHVGIQKYAH